MKNKFFLLSLIIITCLPILLISCSNQKTLKAVTPVNTAIIMKNFLDAGNYEDFNKLFSNGRKDTVPVEQFNELKKLTAAGTDFKHFELLTFSNGKMILITLTQERIDDEYKIEDVKEIPDEMKSLFK